MRRKKRKGLILSLFPGADLLGRGFEAEGWCVVRGPDKLWGGDIRSFEAVPGMAEGIIGGSPCQDFSKIRRAAPTGEGIELLGQFARIVDRVSPSWWLLENVPQVPNVHVDGYKVQRFNLSAAECGVRQRRLRRFQFGYLSGAPLVIRRVASCYQRPERCCLATEFSRPGRRSFADFCELQGLPRSFDLPGLSMAAKYRAVGNGVPVPMGRVIAAAIAARAVTADVRVCVCECGRPVQGNQRMATASCRKRMQRLRRDSARVTELKPVTATGSL